MTKDEIFAMQMTERGGGNPPVETLTPASPSLLFPLRGGGGGGGPFEPETMVAI